MESYQRVTQPRQEALDENEVRITAQGMMRNYVSYGSSLLQDRGVPKIVLKAMGRAINKAVMVAETIKRRIEGLHEDVTISSTDVTDLWEPLEEGLEPLEMVRHVSIITITLSKEMDVSSRRDQRVMAKRVQPIVESNNHGGIRARGYGSGRGQVRGRGGNMFSGGLYYATGDENWYRERGRGGVRGRSRSYNGSGREYNSGEYYHGDYEGYNGGYNNIGYSNGGFNSGYSGEYEYVHSASNTDFHGRGWGFRGGRARGRGA